MCETNKQPTSSLACTSGLHFTVQVSTFLPVVLFKSQWYTRMKSSCEINFVKPFLSITVQHKIRTHPLCTYVQQSDAPQTHLLHLECFLPCCTTNTMKYWLQIRTYRAVTHIAANNISICNMSLTLIVLQNSNHTFLLSNCKSCVVSAGCQCCNLQHCLS